MRIKVMLASNDSGFIKQITTQAKFNENKMEVLSWVTSGEEIFQRFEEINPRLVIIDKDLDGLDAITCIRRIYSIKKKCKVLVIGGKDDADFMYRLLEIQVYGYVSKPIDIEKINNELERISRDIRRINIEQIQYDASLSMQSLYFWKLMFEKSDMALDLNFLNSIMKSGFKKGMFRALLFRLDEMHGEMPNFKENQFYTDLSYIQQQIKMNTNNYIYEYCYEMIFDFRFNGVLAIINYDKQYDEIIKSKFEDIRRDSEEYAIRHYGMSLTLCVGNGYEDHTKVPNSREEAYSSAWARMKQGTRKVLYYKKTFDIHVSYKQKLERIVEQLKSTADTLNVDEFHNMIKQLFELPDYVLTEYNSRNYLMNFVDTFFEINGKVLVEHMNVEVEKEYIKKILNYSRTLEDYQKNLEQKFDQMFKILADDAEKQNFRPLRKAIKYIKENYDKQITAETLAEVVNLSPVYFSHLFKKQTGKNMTDYITEYRMEIAKKMLFDTDKTIFEIAVAVGFQDQRYFSIRFKQIVGKTPSEYRKLK